MNERSRIKRVAVLLLVVAAGVAGAAAMLYPPGIGSEGGRDAARAGVPSESAGQISADQVPDTEQVSGVIEDPSPGAEFDPKPRPATETRVNPAGTRKGLGLYITYCLGCHGASGLGGGCPPLDKKNMSFEAFLAQLRLPRVMMPAIPESDVSVAEARQIYDYLQSVR
jgi:hypothetical protein